MPSVRVSPGAARGVPLAQGLEGTQGGGRARGSQADPAPASLGFPRLAEKSLTRSNQPKIEKLTQGKRQGPKSVPRRSCCSRCPRESVRLPLSSGSLNPPRKQRMAWYLQGPGTWTGLAGLYTSLPVFFCEPGLRDETGGREGRPATPRPFERASSPQQKGQAFPSCGLALGSWSRLEVEAVWFCLGQRKWGVDVLASSNPRG